MSARSSTTIGRRALVAAAAAIVAASCGSEKKSGDAEGAEPIKVAAASDLSKAFEEVAAAYEKTGKRRPKLTLGSTGLLSRQIVDGAPFDVFAAANVSFVDDVVRKAGCDGESKALYARGRIVVWVKEGAAPKALAELASDRYTKIAIANPEHAPYGKAAKEALQSEGVWRDVESKLVFGENISQTLQYAQTGNADVGIVALSLAIGGGGSYELVDDALHAPLDQALVVCARGARAAAAKDFATYVNSAEGRAIMKKWGLLLPGEKLSER